MAGTSSHLFDEARFPIAWRFNAADCGLSADDKQRVVLFDQAESQVLWDRFIPVPSLITGLPSLFQCHEKTTLDFAQRGESSLFFERRLSPEAGLFWLFWGRCCAAQVPRDIFIKCWDDFFYPSDENTALVMPGSAEVMFSFEENLFYGQFVRPMAAPL
ncbi:hypothetical protein P7C00_00505 [Pseudomonas sp. JDS08PS003]|uniref:hypothetical protein n=1 Tax=Pseudomonas sp. JDS08PS003 TaxID=2497162 RepID=UPI003857E3B0